MPQVIAPKPTTDAGASGARPVRRANMLRDAIAQEIATGEIAPGERLDEVALSRRFGVSRTPIREALMQLGTMGLVEMQPHRGAFVRKVGIAELVEMIEVMAELEGMCARLAARRMSSEEIDVLERIHLDCAAAAESGDPDAYYYENERFHRALYAGCHNNFLMEEAVRLHERTKVYRRLQLRVRGRIENSFSEHAAVVETIRAGDPRAAERAAREHVLIQGERFNDFVASLDGDQG